MDEPGTLIYAGAVPACYSAAPAIFSCIALVFLSVVI